jgi:hypothetical protein
MTMKAEIKACLLESMQLLLDTYMAEHGFVRRQSSLIYKRQIGEATQTIDLALQIHPKDNPDAAAAVYPIMEVLIPDVDHIKDDIVNNNLGLLQGVTNALSNQPIGFTSQKVDPGRWFIYQSDSVSDVIIKVRDFIDRWTIPFLDIYFCAKDIVDADEKADGRMVSDRAHIIRIVAASLICNRKDYAKSTMERWLGSPELRRIYKPVYDYIDNWNYGDRELR